jgi:hypothetical protein
VDNDRTISNVSRKRTPERCKESSNSKVNQKDVHNYYSGHINNVVQAKGKPKEMPKDQGG